MNVLERIRKTVTIMIVFTIFNFAFNPAELEFWQNIAVFLSIGFIAIGGIALTWVKSCI